VIHIIPVSEPKRKSVIEDIILTGHKAMVLGRVDTGKSTFCRQLAFYAQEKGLKVAIVDADVGQSWIGPPTTVGMKVFADAPSEALFPDAFYFVGSVTPERHLLQTAVGVKCMVEKAESDNADLTIIDTTGLVDKSIGRALKQSKFDIIKPDHVVCFQRDGELEILIRGFEIGACHIHRLEPSRYAEKKSQAFRSRYRGEQFSRYFSNAKIIKFPFSRLCGQRDAFLNGRQAKPKEIENISQILDMEVIYAEFFFRGMFVVTQNQLGWVERQKLRSQLKIEDLIAKTPDDYMNSLVALVDENGDGICLGIIELVDFCNCIMEIRCGIENFETVRAIQFSDFKVT